MKHHIALILTLFVVTEILFFLGMSVGVMWGEMAIHYKDGVMCYNQNI
jgi:hypothetical protein